MQNFSWFETVLQVRPDDIDMNQHVHGSRYYDYVLAARYDQMERCYRMSMGEFLKLGLSWVVRAAFIEYKRPLFIAEYMVVRTRVESIAGDTVRVAFEVVKKEKQKIACTGYFDYTLVSAATGRATDIPPEIVAKYSI